MYYCNFPSCSYVTESRHQIHNHHIIGRSAGGSNKKHNLIMLCPNCHSKVYQPDAERGIHNIKTDCSIILLGKVSSTGGHLLEYSDLNGNIDYSLIKGI